jgi:hypothetical protein
MDSQEFGPPPSPPPPSEPLYDTQTPVPSPTFKAPKDPGPKRAKRKEATIDGDDEGYSADTDTPKSRGTLSKMQRYDPSARLLLQPMLAITLFTCKSCTDQSRKGAKTTTDDGKTGLLVVMCDHCLEWNGRLRSNHLDQIAFPRTR